METKLAGLLTDEHRAWIGKVEPARTVEVSRRDIIKYAVATEQTQRKYLDGDEAPPMFIFNLFGTITELENLRPDGLARGGGGGPRLPLQRVMAGGTEIRQYRPIKPGDRLTGVQSITELYEKQGSTGPLIFTVRTLSVTSDSGEPVLDEIQTGIAR
jgi:3-methylfumaryl-CoA hydratase